MREALEAERKAQRQRDEDRREHKRIALRVAVTASSADNFFTGLSEDLSEGGVFLTTYCPPQLGAVVELSIAAPAGSFRVTGEVRWHGHDEQGIPFGCGIRFLPMSPVDHRRLIEAVSHSGQQPLFIET